jgi:hypothetical protein
VHAEMTERRWERRKEEGAIYLLSGPRARRNVDKKIRNKSTLAPAPVRDLSTLLLQIIRWDWIFILSPKIPVPPSPSLLSLPSSTARTRALPPQQTKTA